MLVDGWSGVTVMHMHRKTVYARLAASHVLQMVCVYAWIMHLCIDRYFRGGVMHFYAACGWYFKVICPW